MGGIEGGDVLNYDLYDLLISMISIYFRGWNFIVISLPPIWVFKMGGIEGGNALNYDLADSMIGMIKKS